jgi:hypothetical protein
VFEVHLGGYGYDFVCSACVSGDGRERLDIAGSKVCQDCAGRALHGLLDAASDAGVTSLRYDPERDTIEASVTVPVPVPFVEVSFGVAELVAMEEK